jgi:hypothetical protein
MTRSSPSRAGRRRELWLVGGVWLAVAALIVLRQLGRHTPTVFLDELVYGRLAQNLAGGEGFSYQGTPSSFHTVYPYLIAPAWLLFKGTTAYHVALGINGVVMSTALFPAYGLARRVAPIGLALAAAAGAVLIPSMVWAGMLMTEALAYPTAALALFAMVEALRRPGPRTALLVMVAIAAAIAARSQMYVLLPAFALAIGIDVVARGRAGALPRLRELRFALGALAVVGVLGGVATALKGRDALFGTHARVIEEWPGVRALFEVGLDYIGVIALAALVVPLIGLVALVARRASWRERDLSPLLAVALAATLVFMGQAAWLSVTVSPELWERYVFYVTPALTACWVAMRGRVGVVPVAVVTLLLFLYLAPLFPGVEGNTEWGDERGLFGVEEVTDRLSLIGNDTGWLAPVGNGFDWLFDNVQVFALVALGLGALAALSTRVRGTAGALLLVIPGLAFGVVTFNVRQLDANRQSYTWQESHEPADWIDARTDGHVGVVKTPETDTTGIWHFELWNEGLDRAFGIDYREGGEIGQVCPLTVGSGGAITLEHPCAGRPLPRYLLFADPSGRYEVLNGRLLGEHVVGGRLYEVPRNGPLRVKILRPVES